MSDPSVWFFISSGLFLGWSLGANNAVTLFGTAVASKMVKFRIAAVIAGVCAIAGAFVSGAGTTNTLTTLGGVNALAGSFTAALSVGIAVTWMTRARLPVSASQAVVGAIIGWNLFTGSPTDMTSLSKILGSWLVSPLIAGIFGFVIFRVLKRTVLKWKIHMLTLDSYTRVALIVVGALASYSMGANNIANVMGMFVQSSPFRDIQLGGVLGVSGVQQLFLLGGLAIAVGVYTYGHKVIETVGSDLFKISPITGFAVVLSEFIVLFLFTSQTLEGILLDLGLPAIPLVPLSATQAFIGAVIGVGLAKDPQSVDFKVLGKISVGWVVAPLSAGIMSFVLLYVVQNVFEQKVITPTPYRISASVLARLQDEGVRAEPLADLLDSTFTNAKTFSREISERGDYSSEDMYRIFNYAVVDSFRIDSAKAASLDTSRFGVELRELIRRHHGRMFSHRIDFDSLFFEASAEWRLTGDARNDAVIRERKQTIEQMMRIHTANSR